MHLNFRPKSKQQHIPKNNQHKSTVKTTSQQHSQVRNILAISRQQHKTD